MNLTPYEKETLEAISDEMTDEQLSQYCNTKTGLNFGSLEEFDQEAEKTLIENNLPIPTPGENGFPDNGVFPFYMFEKMARKDTIEQLKKYSKWASEYFYRAFKRPLHKIIETVSGEKDTMQKTLKRLIGEVYALLQKMESLALYKRNFNGQLNGFNNRLSVGIIEDNLWTLQMLGTGRDPTKRPFDTEVLSNFILRLIELMRQDDKAKAESDVDKQITDSMSDIEKVRAIIDEFRQEAAARVKETSKI